MLWVGNRGQHEKLEGELKRMPHERGAGPTPTELKIHRGLRQLECCADRRILANQRDSFCHSRSARFTPLNVFLGLWLKVCR